MQLEELTDCNACGHQHPKELTDNGFTRPLPCSCGCENHLSSVDGMPAVNLEIGPADIRPASEAPADFRWFI